MRLIRRAALLGERIGERLFSERVGVGRAMFLVLRTIGDAGEDGVTSQQWIAGRLSLTKGAVSRHVATAVAHGWLSAGASPVSRRERALMLTAAGRELVERGRIVQLERERLADAELDAGDVAAATRTLTVLCRMLEREDKQ